MQPGRNAPCPCGSGKKYKKCCAPKDAENTTGVPPELRALQGNPEETLDPEFAESMLAAIRNLQKTTLERQPHIKTYYKIRKMHGEIVDAMIRYWDDGKFEQQIDEDSDYFFADAEGRELRMLNASFNPETREGAHAFYDMLIYKPAPNMNCITEEFLRKNRYRKPEKIAFLQSMLDSRLGLYEITATDVNQGYAYLREVFTGEERRITDVGLSGDLHVENFYLYTRIIDFQGVCFGTGLNLVFKKGDPFIQQHIQKHKKRYSPLGEFVRFIELYNRFSQDADSVQVAPNGIG
jgi:hypothetical protein